MSCNYAEGLSPYEHKGKLGLPEFFDDEETVDEKVGKLAEWIRAAKHVVVHTGAGISTSAGIPDFRGPNGVWTLEEKGLKPEINVSFDGAKPTVTHMGLAALVEAGFIKYIITQNIDGLHLRSGIRRTNISELHGNMFVSRCSYCEREFVLPKSVPTVGQKEIGLDCPYVKHGGRVCRGKLKDNILDWEDNLPDKDLDMADMNSTLADLSICLGTTLQIIPAGNLPLKAKKNGGKVAIVNLQETKHHKKADLVIHTFVDKVISKLAGILGVEIPQYSEHVDRSLRVRKLGENNEGLGTEEWTIPASIIKQHRNLLSTLKRKPEKKAPVQKKRRRNNYYEVTEKKEDGDETEMIDEKKKKPCSIENVPATRINLSQDEDMKNPQETNIIPLKQEGFAD